MKLVMKKILSGLTGFLIHSLLLIGGNFSQSSAFEFMNFYASSEQPDRSWLVAIIFSLILSGMYYTILKLNKKETPTSLALAFFLGSLAAFAAIKIFVWWSLKDFFSGT